MCRTPWCFGDCEECEANKKVEQEYEDSIKECPYKSECSLTIANITTDICVSCGKIFNY